LAPLPHQAISARTVAVDATMIQEFFYVRSVDGVYWTLTIELSFYAVMLALFTAGWLRRIESCVWCWLGLVLAARGMSMIGFDLPFRLTLLFVLQYAQWFVLGIVFYLVRESGYTLNRSALIGACVLIEAMVADLTTAFVMAGLILLFALCVGRWLRMLARGPLIWLGAISYPLYLTHQMIGYRILTAFLDAGWNEAAAIAATIALALLLASAITMGIERPAMRSIRSWYRGTAAKIARLQPTLETRRQPVKGE
jgi:peptidoglycan/LPS O-acetylase OafA/YrhL